MLEKLTSGMLENLLAKNIYIILKRVGINYMKNKHRYLLAFITILLIICIVSFYKFDRYNNHVYKSAYDNFPQVVSLKINPKEVGKIKRVVYRGYNTDVILNEIKETDESIFIYIDSNIKWGITKGECLSRIIILDNSSKNVLSTKTAVNENIYYDDGQKVPHRLSTGPRNRITFIIDKNNIEPDKYINIEFSGYKIWKYNMDLKAWLNYINRNL